MYIFKAKNRLFGSSHVQHNKESYIEPLNFSAADDLHSAIICYFAVDSALIGGRCLGRDGDHYLNDSACDGHYQGNHYLLGLMLRVQGRTR